MNHYLSELEAALEVRELGIPAERYTTGVGEDSIGNIYTGKEEVDFEAYCQTLEKRGYAKYTKHDIGAGPCVNRFATYTNQTKVVNVAWTPALGRITAMADSLSGTALPGLERDNVWKTGVCDTTITQIGLWGHETGREWDRFIHGLSHVVRLGDGSFIIIDGGNDREIDAHKLYETLRKQAPDPEHITVAAWILTHAHSDHTGALVYFDHEDVTIERFIYNFPTLPEVGKTNGGECDRVEAVLQERFGNVEKVKAHPGQRFFLRNAEIEILWTLDFYYPMWLDNFNNTSVLFTLTLNGHKNLYLADMGQKTDPVLRSIYGESLKSEVVQIAHHGFDGGSIELYYTIAPKYVFINSGSRFQWSDRDNGPLGRRNGNNYFYNVPGIENWFAADTVIVVTYRANEPLTSVAYGNFGAFLESKPVN